MELSLKEVVKSSLLDLGLYHKINNFRFRNDSKNALQTQFYQSVIKPDHLVFDIGANVGQRSEIFARLARRVVAIEPQPNCIRHLKSRFKFNRKVVIEECALAETPGEATMWQSESSGISSMSRRFIDTMGSSVFRDQKWDKEIRVQTLTVDELIARHGRPNFVKIDVEGYELTVLKGLSVPVGMLSFEFTPEMIDDSHACIERLNAISKGYCYNYCLGENLDFVLPNHVDYDSFRKEYLPAISRLETFGDIYAVLDE